MQHTRRIIKKITKRITKDISEKFSENHSRIEQIKFCSYLGFCSVFKRYLLFLGFVIFSLILIDPSFANNQSKSISLGLNWKAEPEFGGFYQIKENNLDKAIGYDLKIQEGGAGTPTVQMIASGKIDYGIVSGDELILARDRGADVVGVFAVFQKAPYAILTKKEHRFNSLQDLFSSSAILAVVKGLPFVSFLENKYKTNRKVTLVPYLGGVGNFLSQKSNQPYAQQGFISSEPLLLKKAKVDIVTHLIADEGFNPYVVVLATRGKRILENKREVTEVVGMVRKGWAEYLKDPQMALKRIAALNTGLEESLLKQMSEIERAFILPSGMSDSKLGKMEKERWKVLQKQLKDLGLISSLPDPNSYFENF